MIEIAVLHAREERGDAGSAPDRDSSAMLVPTLIPGD